MEARRNEYHRNKKKAFSPGSLKQKYHLTGPLESIFYHCGG